jgi:tetratricopeptide (TPR) repeat protein
MMNASELEWLIRDNLNTIRGPFNHSEVLQLLKKGQLKPKTEISRANAYWFAVEEKVELAKFFPELGIKVEDQPTKMTSTLTHADIGGEDPLDATKVTNVTPVPGVESGTEMSGTGAGGKIQWLNDEFAEEFGDAGLAIETRTDLHGAKQEKSDENQSLDNTKEATKNELLNRATVKADTLPSERKSYTGERPKPINSVLKGGDKSAAMGSTMKSNIVNVHIDHPDSQATILPSDESTSRILGSKNKIMIGVSVFIGLLIIGAGIVAITVDKNPNSNAEIRTKRSSNLPPEEAIRKSLLFFSLEDAKQALSDLELESDSKGKVLLPIAQALVRKEFLFDVDGALMSLQTARALAENRASEAEVDNLLSIYRFERDKEGSVESLKRIVQAFPSDTILRYNLGLAQLRNGSPNEAVQTASVLMGGLSRDDSLMEDAAILSGWAKEVLSKGNDSSAESAYLKALEANPNSAKARLGLAIFRFRKSGIKEAESDFRAVLENLPELDPPTRIVNYRKMGDSDFYQFARSQLRELNVPGGAAGNKPSPLATAVDALLSCLQSRMGEAGKMLDLALSAAPGDANILKAVGYHRFKEGRYAEIIDLLKDVNKERNSFALNLLMAKAYLKTGKKDQAEKHLENLVASNPTRSDGWSLLGDYQFDTNRKEEAKKNFHNSLKRDELDLVALRGLDRLGDPEVLKMEFSKSLPF